MRSILIESLFTTSAPSPSNARDRITQAVYTSWQSGDEAGFAIPVPRDYAPGSDFHILIDESSPSVSMDHSWSVTSVLRKQIDGETVTYTESSIHHYTCAEQAGSLVRRTLAVTGAMSGGTIENHSIQPGDYLNFILRRSTALQNEDPLEIRVFTISVEFGATQAGTAVCAGRIGMIMQTVRDLFNEAEGGFLSDDFIIRSINRCQQDLAMDGYWRRDRWVPAVSGRGVIDLLDAIPDVVDVYRVDYGPNRSPMTRVSSFRQLMRLNRLLDIPGAPDYYLIQNTEMMVAPTPSLDLSQGFLVYHSWCPGDLSCQDSNPNPDIPRSFDQLFVYFTLTQAFLKDRSAPGADVKFHEYTTLYQNLKGRLLSAGDPVNASVQPAPRYH